MYKNSILITGTIISMGYFIYKFFNNYRGNNQQYDKETLENKMDNSLEDTITNVKENDADFSYISSYIELVNYIRDLNLIPNKFIYNLINNNNIYISIEDQKWYIKNEDDLFIACNLSIGKEIKKSEKLTKKIESFKTFKDNSHLLLLLKIH